MNKKGFTLVEMLGAIVIIGILSTIGITATTKYLKDSRIKSYKLMSENIYESVTNCMIEGKCTTPSIGESVTVTTSELIQKGYIKNLSNPAKKSGNCDGKVTVYNYGGAESDYNKYNYKVNLNCSGLANTTIDWPEAKSKDAEELNKTIENSLSQNTNSSTETKKIVCKRAENLHTEICPENCECNNFGRPYGWTVVYGNFGNSGSLSVGDAFDCDVNGDGNYSSSNERFYYVTDVDSATAALVFYSNVSWGSPTKTAAYSYATSGNSYNGPTSIAQHMPSSTLWKNVKLKSIARTIKTNTNQTFIYEYYKDDNHKKQIANPYVYVNKAARLLTYQEIDKACGIDSDKTLQNCRFLLENTGFAENVYIPGYYLETVGDFAYQGWPVMTVSKSGTSMVYTGSYPLGARPVIEVPKENIDY